ncbi:FAD binding domain-containing protein [Pseudomassariella vexata]|uniref:FAD binding domain-domain-containing protein n=1 Tax=Pseudomassariella vexata TaxID=1141098 RepID=A0A1Y2DKB7_9PEZI|nr:FAD binding domain-containing protein [Pseudomassariella vexata]ORY59673.1 FAD binding domain-domain-containing protein [Pseudomassariella vexata]
MASSAAADDTVGVDGSTNGHEDVIDVCIVGAGPAGLMLAVLLSRYGINIDVLDERPSQTSAGRADGLQPKSIETLRMLQLADPLLQKGVRIHGICFWKSTKVDSLKRIGREVHYSADVVDLQDDFILLVHQGMVEDVFLDDLWKRGINVKRRHHFESFNMKNTDDPMVVHYSVGNDGEKGSRLTRYVVGCDGARSKVRGCIPDTHSVGKSHESVWGVLDGELVTDFPDIWCKSVVYSEEHGSILIIPRERNMTRFYIEIKVGNETGELRELGQEFVMQRAKHILAPYSVEWRTVEWFGNYQVGQRVAARFCDPLQRAFIAGDASHTHSPKAAQGMNTSMHDSWNLAWKLNFALRGLAKPILLESYELERRKIAHDLINFDYEHANQIAGGDAKALAENFRTNVRFISGVGVEYDQNVLNHPVIARRGTLMEGCLVPPAKVTRYIDANPVDIQLAIPMLGQFRIYLFVSDVIESKSFLESCCATISKEHSFISRLSVAAAASYKRSPRRSAPDDIYLQTHRYTSVSELMTFSLVTTMEKSRVEIKDLPQLLAQSAWTFYLDDVPHLDTRKMTCTSKWVGGLTPGEVAIVNVRPDGYVGSIGRFNSLDEGAGDDAAKWLNVYYEGFLQVPNGI